MKFIPVYLKTNSGLRSSCYIILYKKKKKNVDCLAKPTKRTLVGKR